MAAPGRGARGRQCPGPSGLAQRPAGQGLTAPDARRARHGGQDRSPPARRRRPVRLSAGRYRLAARICAAIRRSESTHRWTSARRGALRSRSALTSSRAEPGGGGAVVGSVAIALLQVTGVVAGGRVGRRVRRWSRRGRRTGPAAAPRRPRCRRRPRLRSAAPVVDSSIGRRPRAAWASTLTAAITTPTSASTRSACSSTGEPSATPGSVRGVPSATLTTAAAATSTATLAASRRRALRVVRALAVMSRPGRDGGRAARARRRAASRRDSASADGRRRDRPTDRTRRASWWPRGRPSTAQHTARR